MPEEWAFDFPHWLVKLGVQVYRASGKREIPDLEKLTAHDPRWVSDILFADSAISFYENDDPILKLFEKQRATDKDKP